MKKIAIIFMFISFSFLGFSQSIKVNYANKLYETFSYVEASEVYEELYRKNKLSQSEIEKMAHSYYNTRNYDKAFYYYNKLFDEGYHNLDKELFIDCALRLSKIDFIKSEFQNYKDEYGRSILDLEETISKTNHVDVYEWEHNSGNGDFGLSYYKSDTFFTSNRELIGFTSKPYSWDKLNFTKVYYLKNGSIKNLNTANSIYHDGPISFNEKNDKAYLTRTYRTKGKNDKVVKIFESVIKFDSKGNYLFDWELSKINKENYNFGHVSFNEDFSQVFFVSDMPGGKGGTDIYFCKINNNGTWGNPINLEVVNTKGNEIFPFYYNDELYFSTNGTLGFGGYDIYKYDFNEKEYPINMGEKINSLGDDFSFILINDNNYYLSSDRNKGIDNVFIAIKKSQKGWLSVNPLKSNRNPIKEDVSLLLVDRESSDTILFNSASNYTAPLLSHKDYIVTGEVDGYELTSPLYLNTDFLENEDTITVDILFNQMRYDLLLKTINSSDGKPLAFVDGFFTDPATKQVTKFKSNSEGFAYVNLDNYTYYDVFASKKGFLEVKESLVTDGDILIQLDLIFTEIKKDVKFELENIFYDLDKFVLRDSSKIELDKLVDFLELNENIRVELSSHTDSRGGDGYNLTLSQKRAKSCVDYLLSKGIGRDRLVAKGYGESKLINHCGNGVICDEEEHQRNRRTEIKILEVK